MVPVSGVRTEAAVVELRRVSAEVDRALHAFVDRQPLSDFYDLVRYHLGWGAPNGAPAIRSRAVLCVLACRACGGTTRTALPMAVAIALLHSFASNQEDLERHREVSRGRPTVGSVWGTPQAMNAGDGMHALAKMALLEARDRIPAQAILRLEEALDECSLSACEILHQELLGGSTNATELAVAKSSVLFACAGWSGCYLAGTDEALSERMRRFGELLGAASADGSQAQDCHSQALQALELTGLTAAKLGPLRALAEYVMRPGALT